MLFYISKKGNQVPITSIKVITKNSVILNTGETIADISPEFRDIGSEVDTTSTVVLNSLLEINKELNAQRKETIKLLADIKASNEKFVERVQTTVKTQAAEARDLTRAATSLNNSIAESCNESISKANAVLKSTSESVTSSNKLTRTLNGYIQEFEEQIASISTTA